MKVTANTKYKTGKPMSYRMTIGCSRAREYGLVDEYGNGATVIPIQTANGVLIIPVAEPLYSLEYKGFRTNVFQKNTIFCGEVSDSRRCVSWFAKDERRAEQAFHNAVDGLLGLPSD